MTSKQNWPFLNILARSHLKLSILLLCSKSKEINDDELKYYFEKRNPEKNIPLVLDFMFQKIMILLSGKVINYSSIVR